LTTFDPFINLAKTGPNAEKIRPGRKTKIEPDLEKPGPESAESEDWIEDEDMNLLFGLTVGAILLKMFVVVFWSQWLLKF